MIEQLFDLDNLYDSLHSIHKASGWKDKTRRYENNFALKILSLQEKLINHTYKPFPPKNFLYNERGKIRNIESYTIEDRIVMDVLCNKILLPCVRKKLIYDNSASLAGRGPSHFNKRLIKNLREFKKVNGNDGYILVGDFKKYFDNLGHDNFINNLRNFGIEEDVLSIVKMFLKIHRIDLSDLSLEEVKKLKNEPFDSVKFMKGHPEKYFLNREVNFDDDNEEKYLTKSLGIGSMLAQIAGVIGAYKIDNYCKIVKGIKYYGRYMDDFYIISKDKEKLKDILKVIKQKCAEENMFLNTNKTQIIKLTHSFTILKIQYKFCDDKIIRVPCKDTFHREQRKLKKWKKKLDEGILSFEDILNSYKSWDRNIYKRFGNCRSLINTRNLFDSLFIKNWIIK